jgi:hypothetical protein
MRKSAKQSGVHGENAAPGHRDSGGPGKPSRSNHGPPRKNPARNPGTRRGDTVEPENPTIRNLQTKHKHSTQAQTPETQINNIVKCAVGYYGC